MFPLGGKAVTLTETGFQKLTTGIRTVLKRNIFVEHLFLSILFYLIVVLFTNQNNFAIGRILSRLAQN